MFYKILLLLSFSNFVINQNSYCRLRCNIGNESVSHTVCDRVPKNCGPASKCGQHFKTVNLTDDDRQYILDIHNYLRNKVALGYEKRGNQPRAANMMIMKYNRELEFISQCWANACNGNPLRHDRCRRTAWYDEVTMFNRNWVNVTKDRGTKYQIGHYTQVIWAQTSNIGCAISYFIENVSNRMWHQILFVCNYGPGGNYVEFPVYDTGRPASKCPQNERRNSQYKGLCGNTLPVRDVENFNPDKLF